MICCSPTWRDNLLLWITWFFDKLNSFTLVERKERKPPDLQRGFLPSIDVYFLNSSHLNSSLTPGDVWLQQSRIQGKLFTKCGKGSQGEEVEKGSQQEKFSSWSILGRNNWAVDDWEFYFKQSLLNSPWKIFVCTVPKGIQNLILRCHRIQNLAFGSISQIYILLLSLTLSLSKHNNRKIWMTVKIFKQNVTQWKGLEYLLFPVY